MENRIYSYKWGLLSYAPISIGNIYGLFNSFFDILLENIKCIKIVSILLVFRSAWISFNLLCLFWFNSFVYFLYLCKTEINWKSYNTLSCDKYQKFFQLNGHMRSKANLWKKFIQTTKLFFKSFSSSSVTSLLCLFNKVMI